MRGAKTFLLACSLLAGCGYHLANRQVETGKTIAVPVFVNRSYRPGMEAVLAESIIGEFALHSGGRVKGEDEAELLLSGAVTAYATTPVSFTASDTIKEYRADMTIEATILERATRKVVWKGTLTDSQVYPIDADVALQINREKAAIREICRKLAQRLYQKSGEDF